MTIKHTATDAAGKVHTRTSKSRTYTHCVVVHLPAVPPNDAYPHGWPASIKAEWAGSFQNAHNNAARWKRGREGVTVEILEAQIEIVGSK
jgi:hypothetical protein